MLLTLRAPRDTVCLGCSAATQLPGSWLARPEACVANSDSQAYRVISVASADDHVLLSRVCPPLVAALRAGVLRTWALPRPCPSSGRRISGGRVEFLAAV